MSTNDQIKISNSDCDSDNEDAFNEKYKQLQQTLTKVKY